MGFAYLRVADIALGVDEELFRVLPGRLELFRDQPGTPLLRVIQAKGLYADLEQRGAKSAPLTDRDRVFAVRCIKQTTRYALFSPARATLFIPEEYVVLQYPLDHVGVEFFLMQTIRAAIAQTLLWSGGFVLHAAAVALPEGGVLFSGDPGIGKSTQAALWQRYAGADILNEDSPMIRKEAGQYYCYGNPWSGSASCYKNARARVCALAALRQARENEIAPWNLKVALKFLLTQSLNTLYNEADFDRLVANMTDFAACVPIVGFKCLPDAASVYLLKNHIFGQEGGMRG